MLIRFEHKRIVPSVFGILFRFKPGITFRHTKCKQKHDLRFVYMTKNCVVCIASAYYKTIDTSNLTDYKKCLSENCDHAPLKHFLKLTAHSLFFCEVYCFLFLEKKQPK